MHPDTQQSEVCKMEGERPEAERRGCGKAPKSIFQLSYHLELFSRAPAPLSHTYIRPSVRRIYKHTPRVLPKSRLHFLFLILMFSFTASERRGDGER